MVKKQKWTIILVVVAVAVVALCGFFAWKVMNKNEPEQSNTTNAGAVALNTQQTGGNTISLEPKAPEQKDPNALSVSDSQSTSANMGSGISGQQSSSSNSSAPSQNFSEYEQYKDKNEIYFGEIVVGSGAEAVKDKQLAVTYKGYLTNGQVFDQSRQGDNGQLQPLLFTLGGGQLIPGFEQGVAGMKVGGSRRVIIPPSLGYGDKAQGPIPANSVLIFDIQLTAAQ